MAWLRRFCRWLDAPRQERLRARQMERDNEAFVRSVFDVPAMAKMLADDLDRRGINKIYGVSEARRGVADECETAVADLDFDELLDEFRDALMWASVQDNEHTTRERLIALGKELYDRAATMDRRLGRHHEVE